MLPALFMLSCQNDLPASPANHLNASSVVTGLFARDLPEFPSDPGEFNVGITNPYLNFEPGRIFQYRAETDEGIEAIVVEVLNTTKTILGIEATIVHEQVFLDGKLIEDTFDWYAQDTNGNVWYLGEDTREFEDGEVVSTEGSWEAGVDGAEPGIIMLADPHPGMKYHQEFAEGIAEDMAQVLNLSATVEVPYNSFDNALKTMEWTPLEPGAREFKYYVAGVGLVLEVHPKGGLTRVELVSITG